MVPIVRADKLPEPECSQVRRLILEEGMPGKVSSYEICPKCKRTFDWRWFDDERVVRRDWDMFDRQCSCGRDLHPAWVDDPEGLRKPLERFRPEILRHFLEKRSYTKALEFLMAQMPIEEQEAWKPACG